MSYERPDAHAALKLADCSDWRALSPLAAELRDIGWGSRITYSRKVFVPLTQLCRDVCHYCTFAKTPKKLDKPYLTPEDVLSIARQGAAAGCKEVLFTLGDKPELRYSKAREVLAEFGFDSTLAYLEHVAGLVLKETGLLPHLNPRLLDVFFTKNATFDRPFTEFGAYTHPRHQGFFPTGERLAFILTVNDLTRRFGVLTWF